MVVACAGCRAAGVVCGVTCLVTMAAAAKILADSHENAKSRHKNEINAVECRGAASARAPASRRLLCPSIPASLSATRQPPAPRPTPLVSAVLCPLTLTSHDTVPTSRILRIPVCACWCRFTHVTSPPSRIGHGHSRLKHMLTSLKILSWHSKVVGAPGAAQLRA